jgi:streptogramin lyase
LGVGFFSDPLGVAVGGNGIYVADAGDDEIDEMSPLCRTSRCVTTLVGGFNYPDGVAVDGSGNIYVSDAGNNAVKEMALGCASASCVTTLGGGFAGPEGVAVDGSGNVYVADAGNNLVKEMPPGCASSSCVTMLVGEFDNPRGVAVDGSGNVYVTDRYEGPVEEIMLRGVNFGTVAVGATGPALTLYFNFTSGGNGVTASVLTQGAKGLDFADAGTGSCDTNGTSYTYSAGNSCTVNVTFAPQYAGPRNGAVVLSDASGTIATAYIHGVGEGPQLAFGPAAQSTLGGGFLAPTGVAVDGSGNVYVADYSQNTVTEMPAGCASASCVTPLGGGFGGAWGVAVGGAGNVYVANAGFNTVEEMPPGCGSSSCVTKLGGGFDSPKGLAVDGSGSVYVADYSNDAVKEMPAGCGSASCVTTLGGGFDQPVGVAVDGSGNVYVGESGNNAVKGMPPGCGSASCVATLGGGFLAPTGVAVDGDGNVYVADTNNDAVKEVPIGCGSSCVSELGYLASPEGVTLDGSGNLYVVSFYRPETGVTELNVTSPPSFIFAGATGIGYENIYSPRTATLRNIGNAPLVFPVPLTGENPSVSTNSTNSANFTLDSSNTCPEVLASSSAFEMAAGAHCELEVDFIPTTDGIITGALVLTDNNLNASPAVTQSIALSGTGIGTPIVPYVQDYEEDGGAWQNVSSLTVNYGDTVNLGPQPINGGTWNWYGPDNFTSTSRALYGIALSAPTNTYIAIYTDPSGVQSKQVFTITVNPTPITPYLQVDNGPWQNVANVAVNYGDTVNLGPWPETGGTWSWYEFPADFQFSTRAIYGIPLTASTNSYIATYTNPSGVMSNLVFNITVNPTPIVPYIEVNGGAWQSATSVTVNYGDTVNLGPQPGVGGTWSWTGPGGFASTSRQINGIPLTLPSNVFTATYTNPAGVTSTQVFTIMIAPTPIVPYLEVNWGAWQAANSVTVASGSTVNLGPQPSGGGTWSWSGPGGFSSSAREVDGIPLSVGPNVYMATYTNPAGVKSVETFTITVE